jgi:hypothetical protein
MSKLGSYITFDNVYQVGRILDRIKYLKMAMRMVEHAGNSTAHGEESTHAYYHGDLVAPLQATLELERADLGTLCRELQGEREGFHTQVRVIWTTTNPDTRTEEHLEHLDRLNQRIQDITNAINGLGY